HSQRHEHQRETAEPGEHTDRRHERVPCPTHLAGGARPMLRAMTGNTSDVRVRRLLADDAASVTQLLGQLGYFTDEADVRDRIGAWIGDDRGAAFGARVADSVVACAAVYVVPFFERPGGRARLVALEE